ncbi:MAG: hypothetical protein AABZ39_01360 [Spirochaetota bacterium]
MTNIAAAVMLAFAPLSYQPEYRLPASVMALEERTLVQVRYELMSEWAHHAVLSAVIPLPIPFITIGGSYDTCIEDIGAFVNGYTAAAETLLSYESTLRIGATLTFIRGLSLGLSFEEDLDILANNPVYQPYLSAGAQYDIDLPLLQGTVAVGVNDIALARVPVFNMSAMAEYRPLPFLAVRYVFDKQENVLTHRLAVGAVFGAVGFTATGAFDGTSFSVSCGVPFSVLKDPSVIVAVTGRYHPLLGVEGGVSTSMLFGDVHARNGFIGVPPHAGEHRTNTAEKNADAPAENERREKAADIAQRERMLKRLTVLPFRNDGLRSYEYLKRTIVSAISAQLVKNAGFQTIPYDTVIDTFTKKGVAPERAGLTPETAALIQTTFTSGFAVTGDIVVTGGAVRITAVLYDTQTCSVIDMFIENCAAGDRPLFNALDVLGARIQSRLCVLASEREKSARKGG